LQKRLREIFDLKSTHLIMWNMFGEEYN
jgi:hypothetical protein